MLIEEITMTQSSGSTTQRTGELYSNKFSDGFLFCNKNIMEDNRWLLRNFDVVGFQRNIKKKRTIGEIDFGFKNIQDINSKALFPSISSTDDVIIKKGTLVMIEVTSMSGDMALNIVDKKTNKTKVQHKLSFFNNLFRKANMNLLKNDGFDISNKDSVLVVFVYNGVDPVEMRDIFKSEKFNSLLVHLPFNCCLEWSSSLELSKAWEIADNATKEKERAEEKASNATKEKERAEETTKLIIRNLKQSSNMSVERIAALTGLTEESINLLDSH